MSSWWGTLPVKYKLQIPDQIIFPLIGVVPQRWAFGQLENRAMEKAKHKTMGSPRWVIDGLSMMMPNSNTSQKPGN